MAKKIKVAGAKNLHRTEKTNNYLGQQSSAKVRN
jgi:hypothetical protein